MNAAADGPLLRIDTLTKTFGGFVALDNVNVEIRKGERFGLIGPNGSGKTTLVNCISGALRPNKGAVLFGGEDITQLPPNLRSHRGIARSFQIPRPFKSMTVLENLMVAQHNPLMLASGYTLFGVLGLPSYRAAERAAVDKAKHWLDRIGLTERADGPAGALPYGAQRRLEVARAMCTDPLLLCLDEPAAGLNPRESAELNDLLLAIRSDHGISILLIEHDMSVVMKISDHIVVLDYGVKIADGPPRQVRDDPRVVAAYLGVADEDVERIEAEVGL
jgi:branched-chain amino acid transport system ATP-binding protein